MCYFIIPDKRELKQIAINHSSDFRDFKEKGSSFLFNDATLASDNLFSKAINSNYDTW